MHAWRAVNLEPLLTRARFNLSLRGAQRRVNVDEAEHASTNRRYYGHEIANARIEYGVAMTKWVRVNAAHHLTVLVSAPA